MTSTTYRQSASRRPELEAVDPSNQLFGRMNVRRLDAEVLRDRVLASSSSLQQTMFGKPIPVVEDFVGQVIVNDTSRRSVYVQQKRSKPETLMRAFDAPVMECNCDKRSASTVATQSLMLMNNEFVAAEASRWAARAVSEHKDARVRLDSMFLRAYGRLPDATDRAQISEFLDQQAARYPRATAEDARVWADLAHVIFNSKEFIFVR